MSRVTKLFSLFIALLIITSLSVVMPVLAASPENTNPPPHPNSEHSVYEGLLRIGISDFGELLSDDGYEWAGLEYPAGYEHIATGDWIEGYLVAYEISETDYVAYSMYGDRDGFVEVSHDVLEDSSSELVVEVVTQTEDGALTLTQTFEMDKNENYVDITMELENTGESTLSNVILKRCADLDVDTGGDNGWAGYGNIFDIDSGDNMVYAYTTDTFPYDPRPAGAESHYVGLAGSPEPDFYGADEWNDYYQRESPVDFTSYPVEGDYMATLEWHFGGMSVGESERVTATYSVWSEECERPTASISASITMGDAPLTVQFRGHSNQSDVDYFWSFDTGDDSDSRSPEYTFQNEGSYTVYLRVTNECGKSATDSVTINVEAQNLPPKLVVQDLNISSTYAKYGEPVYITATVFNEGGSWGSQDMPLLINGQFEQSVPVGVAAGTGQTIAFTVYKTEAREYQVTIGDATGTFYIMQEATQQPQKAGLLAGGELDTGGIIAIVCIGVIIIAGIVLVFLFARRP